MAETENLQVGWLKTRDGSKFTPYTLTENIYNQDGTLLTSDLDKITSRVDGIEQVGLPNLETNIFDVSGRTTDLEIRTQYLDASASDKFYITDGNGNIIAQVDSTGVKSINFTSYDGNSKIVDLNSLAATVDGLSNTSLTEIHEKINGVSSRTTELETRTQYLDASEGSDKFYITDNNGNIIMQVDSEGIKSINFTSYNGTTKVIDLNEVYNIANTNSDNIKGIMSTSLPNLSARTTELETRTQYLDASEGSDKFYITDEEGNIVMQVDAEGIKSINFTSYNGTTKVVDLNTINNTTIPALQKSIDDNKNEINGIKNTAIPNLKTELEGKISANTNSINTINNTTIPALQKNIGDNADSIKTTNSNLDNLAARVSTNESDISGITSNSIPSLQARTKDLEIRTQYLDASANDKFYIADNSGNIIAQIDSAGIKSINFTSYNGDTQAKITDLNSLNTKTNTNANNITAITNTTIPNLKTELEGKITANTNSINTINNTTVPNLKKDIKANTDAITTINNTTVPNLQKDIKANTDNIAAINNTAIPNLKTKLEGKIKTNSDAITAINTATIPGVEAKVTKNITDITTINNTTIPGVEAKVTKNTNNISGLSNDLSALTTRVGTAESTISGHTTTIGTHTTQIGTHTTQIGTHTTQIGTINSNISDHEARITNNKSEIDGLTNATIPAISTRVTAVETRTQYMDASEGSEIFYITDKNGNIIMQVDSSGIKSINFTSYSAANTKVADLNAVNTQVNTNKNDISGIKNTTIPTLKAAVLYYSIENSITI